MDCRNVRCIMNATKKLIALCVSMFTMFTFTLNASPLKCNFTSADISTTPDEHVMLAGFAARTELSNGIHLQLRTSCLTISDGNEKVCIISNDLMEVSPALADEIRDSISARSGLAKERILMHNIHSHSAPRMGGVAAQPGGSNYEYRIRSSETIISNAVKCITSESDYKPFHLEIAEGSAYINYNRCETAGPVDRTLYAAKIVTAEGKPICAFYNYACHPVSMGPESLLLSSDYSGVARGIISKKWGCEVFQLTGAAGNMDPVGGSQKKEHAEVIGTQLAEILSSLKFKKVKRDNVLKFATGKAELPYLIDNITVDAIKAHADEISGIKTDFPSFPSDVRRWEAEILGRLEKGPIKNTLDFNLSAVNIDGVIFFFTQGEPFCEYQMDVRKAFPSEMIFFAGYTNGQNSYLPSEHAYQFRKGYEYEIEQMHIYIKSPYPLSPRMPEVYRKGTINTINKVK